MRGALLLNTTLRELDLSGKKTLNESSDNFSLFFMVEQTAALGQMVFVH